MSGSAAFNVTLDMLTDWRIGAGRGRQGDIDGMIARDADGLPFIPATSARGMWRDAAEQLAFALDDGEPVGAWSRLVELLFGSQPSVERAGARSVRPVEGRLRIDDLRLPGPLRAALRGPEKAVFRDALTFVKPGVKIDPRTVSAQPDFLRFDELARKDCMLTGACRIDVEDAGVAAFAVAALGLLERIGGDRRRGAGACKASISHGRGCAPKDIPDAIKLLSRLEEAPCVATTAGDVGAIVYRDRQEAPTVIEVPLVIRLDAATVVAEQVLGNVVASMTHVPGDMLLPIVRRALDEAGVARGESSRMIANGEIRVAAAHPEIDGQRGLPVPFSWETAKDARTEVGWRVRDVLGEGAGDDAAASREPQVPMREGYVSRGAAEDGGGPSVWRKAEVAMVAFAHNSVEDAAQKPNSQVGGLFTIEAIAAGQVFRSAIRLPAALRAEAERLKMLLSGREITLGRAGRVGYGRARIEALAVAGVDNRAQASPEAVIWFVSDVCLSPAIPEDAAAKSDLRGLLEAELSRAMGVPVEIVDDRLRARRRESWHRGWGLPRFSLLLLAGGSVARIRATSGDLPTEALRRLEADGIGARRAEGYGEVRIVRRDDGWTGEFEVQSTSVEQLEDAPSVGALADDPAAASLAARIESEAWRRYIAQQVEVMMTDPAARERVLGFNGGKPTMSQLGTLRAVLNGARSDADIAAVRDWLAAMENVTPRKEQWQVAGPRLERLLDDPFAAIADATGAFDGAPPDLLRTRGDINADPALRRHVIVTTVLAAIRAEKRARERVDDPSTAVGEVG